LARYLDTDHEVAVGGDVRFSSEELKTALIKGLRAGGVSVIDMGLCGTEEVYFAVFSQNLAGGVEVTGSHNPADDNGFKLVREQARPVSRGSGLEVLRQLVESPTLAPAARCGGYRRADFRREYVEHLLGYVELAQLPPLTIAANSGHGVAGPVLDAIEARLLEAGVQLTFVKIGHQPNGSFPMGLPNPLLPQNRGLTAQTVIRHGADLGVAWDGDFDRCFFFDEKGTFIEGYYLVGLLADYFLLKYPLAAIIHDPRLIWNTIDIVIGRGGRPIQSKTGHAFMKEKMREARGVYGGEMSAHHYFADFGYCDSGMIPWLVVIGLLGATGRPLSSLVSDRQALFPCSGEINYRAEDPVAVLKIAESCFGPKAISLDYLDGLSLEMTDWRFNLRQSNTEPLVRLNIETRGRPDLVTEAVTKIESISGLVRI
jgi:phosphomannomutase